MRDEIVSDNSFQRDVVASMLLPGEKIVHIAAISQGIYWKGIAVLGVALVALFYGVWLAVYFAVVAAVMLLLAYSTRKYLVLAATDHRIIIRAGILNQEMPQLRYHQIESIDLLYTLPGTLLGYSSVIITGTGRMRLIVPFVEDGEAFRDDIMQRILEKEDQLEHKAA